MLSKEVKHCTWLAAAVVMLLILLVFLTPMQSFAEDKYWFGGTGSWDDPNNWSPYGVPTHDNAYLTNDPDSSATVFSSADNPVFHDLSIYGTGTETMTLSLSAGYLTSASGFRIGNNGVVNQTGGSFASPSTSYVDKGGTYNLDAGNLEFVENTLRVNGLFNQTGGSVHAGDSIDVSGVYNLSGTGEVKSGPHAATSISAGGVFNQYGGTANFTGLYVRGTYNLVTGELHTYNSWYGMRIMDEGTFNQSGGTVQVGSPLYVGYSYDGTKTAGTYNLSGGRLEVAGILVGDRLNYSGGELVLGHKMGESWVSGTLTNNGTVSLSGTGTRVIDGNVTNTGTFKTTHTTAVYTGTFTNNGAYISDPATQYFNDVIIGNTGYFVGQHGDKFYISGDFINHSTMNTDWNTMHSYLNFIMGVDNLHDFYLTGIDYGALMSGYSDNFSWGTLDITGNILSLYDGNEIAGAALYLREILGLDISGSLIDNISGMDGLNIYYVANLKDNDYLGGLVYDLSGGGHLIPIQGVPEPSTILLVGAGLAGLGFVRKRSKN